MRRLAATVLALLLGLTACTGPGNDSTESQAADTPPPKVEEPAQSSEPPIAARAQSAVETLAAETVETLGVSAEEGEAAIRVLYRHLIETVYFADPVGLDIWRWMSEDDATPIPYLENRALSPLLFGIGSCEDFAAAMVVLLRAAGFEAEYVAGYTLSVEQVYIDHAWAIVRLEEEWYHLDPQLEQNVIRGGVLTYRYYMSADEDLLADHRWGENLIAYWPDMPEEEKRQIRALYSYPPCPAALPGPEAEAVPAPPKANMAVVETEIARLKAESGKGELPTITLNVEPPVLVAERHITPPLLDQAEPVYWRGTLEGEEAALYDRLAGVAPELDGEITLSLPMLEPAAIKRAVDAFTADCPTLYWIRFELPEEGDERRLTLAPTLELEEVRRRQAEIDRAAQEILRETEGLAPFEAALSIHDTLADGVRYDYGAGGDSGNLYGALVSGLAYCDGYARAFQYLAERSGLPCAYLTGRSERGVDHAWNAVRLDGVWHYVDATWDRPMRKNDRVYHDYFLICGEELLRERQADTQGLVAEAGEPTGYYERAGYALEGEPDTVALADVFFRQLAASWNNADSGHDFSPFFLEVKILGDDAAYARWKELYIKQVFAILRAMEARAREENLPLTVSFDTSVRCDFNDAMRILTFYPLVKPHADGNTNGGMSI